jgi:hypothetical protein
MPLDSQQKPRTRSGEEISGKDYQGDKKAFRSDYRRNEDESGIKFKIDHAPD